MKFIVNTGILFFLSIFPGTLLSVAQDETPPGKPEIIYVSIDTATGNTDIVWKKSPSPDVARYILYYEVKTINGYEGVKFDSVPGTINSYSHNTSASGLTPPVQYSVSAVDTAGNESARKPGLHAAVYNTVTYDSCNNTLTLQWSKYQGWGNNVSGYRVNARIGTGDYQVLIGLDSSENDYIIYEVPENTQYYFFIEGVKNDGLISFSNITAKNTYMPLPPGDLRLDYVTVTGTQTVEINFGFTGPSLINTYALLRSSKESAKFEPVKILNNVNAPPPVLQDSVFTSVTSYFYRVGAVNTCGEVIDTSNLGTNILLTGRNSGESNVLEWSPYRDFPLGLAYYEVYRTDTAGNAVLIGNSSASETFTDDLSNIYGQDFSGRLTYRVRAVENGEIHDSYSNLFPLDVKSEMWVPNAFTPNGDGINDIFEPRLNFIPEEYLLLIYDRFGSEVFSTKNAGAGWDGRVKGNNPAPEGVYIYHIQYSSFNGQKINKTGNVSVFYPR